MRGYKVTAKYKGDTIKFDLPIGVPQETLNEAYESAKKQARTAFGLEKQTMFADAPKVTIEEYYED